MTRSKREKARKGMSDVAATPFNGKPRYARPLTLDELANLPDEDIDFSDIPELDEDWFARAKLVVPQPKEAVSIRLDADVLEFFRAQGKGYQTRINAVLRAYMEGVGE